MNENIQKELGELYLRALKDKSIRDEFLKLDHNKSEIEKFFRKYGCSATFEDFVKFIKKRRNITDEELDLVTGGMKIDTGLKVLASFASFGIGCLILKLDGTFD